MLPNATEWNLEGPLLKWNSLPKRQLSACDEFHAEAFSYRIIRLHPYRGAQTGT